MIPVLDARQMRLADRRAIASGVPSSLLMENAATALVEELVRARPGWKRVVILCGPGNNGGDGLAAARLLAGRGLRPSVFTVGEPSRYVGDAADNLRRAVAARIEPVALLRAGGMARFAAALAEADGIVDALFGTGLTRPLAGLAARAVRGVAKSTRDVVSADLPSGLSSDSGALLGPCVRASLTVAFGAPKLCHALPPASNYCGRVVVRDIGIPREMLRPARPAPEWVEVSDARGSLPRREREAHKGDFGRLAILAGSRGKAGAAILAARGALRSGAGLVTVFCPDFAEMAIVTAVPEAMTRPLPPLEAEAIRPRALVEELSEFDAVVAGPGLGRGPATVSLLETLVAGLRRPLVADADCLNAFAGRPRVFRKRPGATVLTPHPGEAGRLLGRSARQIQADRLAAARTLARESGAVVLLKGARTLTASPSGRVFVNPTGTPLLSTAGSGDVLAGALGALLAGGAPVEQATWAGAYLHGLAGELLERVLSDAGLLARDLADAIPKARRWLRRELPAVSRRSARPEPEKN